MTSCNCNTGRPSRTILCTLVKQWKPRQRLRKLQNWLDQTQLMSSLDSTLSTPISWPTSSLSCFSPLLSHQQNGERNSCFYLFLRTMWQSNKINNVKLHPKSRKSSTHVTCCVHRSAVHWSSSESRPKCYNTVLLGDIFIYPDINVSLLQHEGWEVRWWAEGDSVWYHSFNFPEQSLFLEHYYLPALSPWHSNEFEDTLMNLKFSLCVLSCNISNN